MASIKHLEQIALRLRHHVLQMTTKAGSGHPSSCMSMAEIAAVLFFHEMKYNTEDPYDVLNDEFVLSKGHAAPLLWACFAEAGIILMESLDTLRRSDSVLEGHPTPRMPWVKAATGSLGQGICVACGMAAANRISGSPARVYCILGDGECAEGSVWEAAGFASGRLLSNLVAIVDFNSLAQNSSPGFDAGALASRFDAFGWDCRVIDGHDVNQIIKALDFAKKSRKPCAIIAKTVKGKGVSFMENKSSWHGRACNQEELALALNELGKIPDVDCMALVNQRQAHSDSCHASPADSRTSLAAKKKNPIVGSGLIPSVYDGPTATREGFGRALAKLPDDRIIAVDADVRNSTRAELFFDKHPDRAIDCHIAEQVMVGVAMGLSAKGFIPFASSFSAFLTRAYDFIRMAGISGLNVKFCGSHAGVATGPDGPSQMGLEDVAMFRSVPSCVVLSPSDAVSAERCTALAAVNSGMAYLRTSRMPVPVLYGLKEEFKIGGSKLLRQSKSDKALVIATGVCVHQAIEAYGELKKRGILIRIIDAYSIQPLDVNGIRQAAISVKGRVIVVEDHYKAGGLGEAVASLLSGSATVSHLCIKDTPRSGKPEELIEHYGIGSKSIVKEVLAIIISKD